MDSDGTHSIEVAVEAPGWRAAVADPEALCRTAVAAALRRLLPEGASAPAEVSVLLTGDAGLRGLNRAWRGRDEATNVLSFPVGDDPGPLPAGAPRPLGDVALGLETVLREAGEAGRPAADHAAHLLVHGVLHLLGHDHERGEAEAEAMERLEASILGGLGIADPYAAPAPAGAGR